MNRARTTLPAPAPPAGRPLGNVLLSGWLTARALFVWLTPAGYVPILLLSPVLRIVFLGMVVAAARRAPETAVVGLAVHNSTIAGIYGALMVVAGDRAEGTLEPVLGTRMPVLARLFGRGVPIAAHAAATSAALLAAAVLLGAVHDRRPATLAGLGLLIAASSASATSFGLLLAAAGLVLRDAFIWANVACLGLLVTSGALLPRAELPAPLRAATAWLPLSHGVPAARALPLGGGPAQAAVAAVAELAVALACLLLAAAVCGRLERRLRREGRLAF